MNSWSKQDRITGRQGDSALPLQVHVGRPWCRGTSIVVSDFKEDGVPTLQNRKDKHINQELEGFLFQVGTFGHALLSNQFVPLS